MRTLLVCFLVFLGSAGSLLAADSFVGTWRLNIAKSKAEPQPPGMAVRAETVVIQEINERYEVTVQGTRENGSPISVRYSVPAMGGMLKYSGGAQQADTHAMKKINDTTVDFIATRNGKVVSTIRATVSANGKAMRTDEKGVDADGKPVQDLEVFDRQ
jgi:hypothetical protein